VGEDVETLKRRLPLLDYLRQQNWTGRPAGRSEFVGLCPLHQETRPSFYVNIRKNVFYCHGCGQGGDLIRFVQLSRHLSFRQSLVCLEPQTKIDVLGCGFDVGMPHQLHECRQAHACLHHIRSEGVPKTPEVDSAAVLEQAAAFYQQQLDHSSEAMRYLNRRGLHESALIRELRVGYAAGGSLRRHLTARGHSFVLLQQVGLLNARGCDAFYQRIVFPLSQNEHIVNLYGRSIGAAFAHRFLPGTKGGLYAWQKVRHCPEVILVEGLFDYVVLRQAGFHNVACSLGTHLNADQFRQLCEGPRTVYITFDVDANQSGQQAAEQLAHRLGAHGVSTRRVLLPPGHDPNSFFVEGGDARQFQSLLEVAPS
jgi:DNA primase